MFDEHQEICFLAIGSDAGNIEIYKCIDSLISSNSWIYCTTFYSRVTKLIFFSNKENNIGFVSLYVEGILLNWNVYTSHLRI